MLITINTASIPPETFRISARKNATTRAGRRCPVPDPLWLTDLIANGCQLQMQDLVVQAGRHFADGVNRNIFEPATTRRQAATAIAWTVVSMAFPSVVNDQLVVVDPIDSDIKRLCSEVLGVGFALEVLRLCGVVDGRTIKKLGARFDYEAFGPDGGARVRIEAKGTFSDASTSSHRKVIADKISNSGLPRGYDSSIGIIASLWPAGVARPFDVEICDPEREPEDHFRDAVREVIRFYARRFDESVAIGTGTALLFAIADDPHLFDDTAPEILDKLTVSKRRVITDLYHNRVAIRRQDVLQEFFGRFWEPRVLPIPLHLDTENRSGKRTAFMGLDSAIFRLIQQRDFASLLSYRTDDRGLWHARGENYSAVFNVDRYGIVRGLIDGELPEEVEAAL